MPAPQEILEDFFIWKSLKGLGTCLVLGNKIGDRPQRWNENFFIPTPHSLLFTPYFLDICYLNLLRMVFNNALTKV
ncbi:hypothetical protein WA1_01425 [Scytonema hofmannii PCC 7110]|uniref:Uncharacterized protein n=1 Tax=Scytonema hofmannii PCC 7110 TaxID=128403 RepID=A0A139XGQ7_9CYAN|nr:hypothetical protein [Scytonema hofmannii]KYC43843.1 hypothetical protein WA1_01425 [Scytonema hofmannii PCC 7110]